MKLWRSIFTSMPLASGFGASERLTGWSVCTTLAYFYRWFIDELQLAPLPIVGFSMGGWLAAEMVVAMYPAPSAAWCWSGRRHQAQRGRDYRYLSDHARGSTAETVL